MMASSAARQNIRRAVLLISLLLFPITMNYLSPYIIIDGAFQGIINGSLVSFALMFIGSLVLGRLWCAWGCPMAGLGEFATAINDRTPNRKVMNWVRWGIWGVWLAAIVAGVVTAGGYHTFQPLYLNDSGISVDEPLRYIMYYLVIGLFLGTSLIFGKRAACHSFCWMAPFMVVGRKVGNALRLPGLRLQTSPADCVDCKKCSRTCPMSLDVNAMVRAGDMEHSECMLCGNCVDVCGKKVIRYAFCQPGAESQK